MRACVWDGVDRLAVEEVPEPVPHPGWVVLDVELVGICGTDLHLRSGHHARAVVGAIPGHEILGRLAQDSGPLVAGTRVFANPFVSCGACEACTARATPQLCGALRLVGADFPGGLAERVLVPETGLVAIPDTVAGETAALVEPVAVASRAVRRARIAPGETVLVIGGGPIGYLLAVLARRSGASRVVLAEPAQARRGHAGRSGLATVADAADAEPADVVFDASGHPAVTSLLGRVTKTGGTIVLVATQRQDAVVDLSRLPFRELTMLGSGGYAALDVQRAVALLGSEIADELGSVVTRTVGLEAVPEALDRLDAGAELKVLVSPWL